jgi:predicted Fe-Mo cluster-binding NifX family protein
VGLIEKETSNPAAIMAGDIRRREMKICFAVERDEGISSAVYGHFGSAPVFIMVDTQSESVETVGNSDMVHVHGACNPINAMGGRNVDAVVVGGIGAGALNRLNAEGIQVYAARAETVGQNIDLMKEGKLPVLTLQHSCAGHQDGGGCGHH